MDDRLARWLGFCALAIAIAVGAFATVQRSIDALLISWSIAGVSCLALFPCGRARVGAAFGFGFFLLVAFDGKLPALPTIAIGFVIIDWSERTNWNVVSPARWLLGAACLSSWLGAAGGGGFGPGRFPKWLEALGLSHELAWALTVGLRKCVHFGWFGAIGVMAFLSVVGAPRSRFGWALGLVALMASFDEARQSLTPNRTGSAWDVLIDLGGAATLCWVSLRIQERRRSKAQPESVG